MSKRIKQLANTKMAARAHAVFYGDRKLVTDDVKG